MNKEQMAAIMWAIPGAAYNAAGFLGIALHAKFTGIAGLFATGVLCTVVAAFRWSKAISLSESKG